MVLNLPLSDRQTRILEDILSRCAMTRDEEALMAPALKRIRENIQYHGARPGVKALDRYYEK